MFTVSCKTHRRTQSVLLQPHLADEGEPQQVVLDVYVRAVRILLLVVPLAGEVELGALGEELLDVEQHAAHVAGGVPVGQLEDLHGGHPQHHAPLQPRPDHLDQRREEGVQVHAELCGEVNIRNCPRLH